MKPIVQHSQPEVGERGPISNRKRLPLAFLAQFNAITPEEYERTSFFDVIDESMGPRLAMGSKLLAVSLEPSAYGQASGIVVITRRSQPKTYFVGRVFSIDSKSIHLSRDNPRWPGLSVDWHDIASVYSVRHLINMPVV